jgi:peptide/nickel transport system substrate-binding protein
VGRTVTPQHDVSEYFLGLLNRLGYRATLHEIPITNDPTGYFQQLSDSRTRAQIGQEYWGGDFPVASNFYAANLSCRSFLPANPTANGNPSEYCNPHVDQLAAEALTTQATDPATARQRWAQVYKTITDDAPWIPTVTPRYSALVSNRLGNYQHNALLGPLLDQMWIK